MARILTENELIVASHNTGKVREIGELIAPFGLEAKSVGELGFDVPVEDGKSFAENAAIKAHAAAKRSGKPALSDDSGLCVDALGGAPGIYSADWAGEPRDFGRAMEKVHVALIDHKAPASEWTAHFTCALCIAWPDGHEEVFLGRVDGHLIWPPRGDHGFGYDPMFIPEGHQQSFGELAPEIKHAMSHRADAFQQLKTACLDPRGVTA
ncbi:MAG: RdgB/HAM1 family non-canonical purine NTP pyrophosphatase [Pseudomonadota bacterium]